MPAKATPGLIRFNITVTGAAAIAAFLPYVTKYCVPRQANNLRAGTRVRIDVPSTQAALELWPLIFAYDTPVHLWQLRDVLIAATGAAPAIEVTDDTEIKWLELGKYENVLYQHDYRTVGDLTATEESQLRANDGIGDLAVEKVKERLAAYELTLFQK